jgi:pyruvate/2-oxoglutarate dehydrogenase complex dihydrolipoamide dehydrogenase (E3) component
MTIRISFSDKTVRVAVEINGAIESAITELPQRTWVGLTDQEIYEIGFDINVGGLQTMKAYKAIEAKLKAKNENL